MLSLRTFIVILFASWTCHQAQAVSLEKTTAELGMGVTDNVYQDDLNKVFDNFVNLGLSLRFLQNQDNINVRLFAQNYIREKNNNYFSYSVRYRTDWLNNTQKLSVSAGGLNYSNIQPAATDESYDNFFIAANSSLSFYKKPEIELFFQYGSKITSYPKLSNRRDFLLFGNINAEWTPATNHFLMPFFELGLLFSSDGYFTRQYTDLGLNYEFAIEDSLTFTSDLYFRSSTYPNRKISDILTNVRRNGRITTVEVEALERTQQTDLSVGIEKEYSDLSIGASYTRSSLGSRSNLEYFNENNLSANLKYSF